MKVCRIGSGMICPLTWAPKEIKEEREGRLAFGSCEDDKEAAIGSHACKIYFSRRLN